MRFTRLFRSFLIAHIRACKHNCHSYLRVLLGRNNLQEKNRSSRDDNTIVNHWRRLFHNLQLKGQWRNRWAFDSAAERHKGKSFEAKQRGVWKQSNVGIKKAWKISKRDHDSMLFSRRTRPLTGSWYTYSAFAYVVRIIFSDYKKQIVSWLPSLTKVICW